MPTSARATVGAASVPLARLRELSAPLLPLPALAPSTYARGHAGFEACSDQRAMLAEHLAGRLAGVPAASGSSRSVLSVGCGDGALDALVAPALAPVDYTGVDPYGPSTERFGARLGALPGVQARARVGRIEELEPGRAHDAVLAVHCLYYVEDLSVAVRRLLAALRPGGALLLVLAPRGPLNALPALLAPPADGRYQWWADDLADVLDRSGHRYARRTVLGRLRLPGSLPDGSLPDGSLPDGPLADGSLPDGPLADGTAGERRAPDDPSPDGAAVTLRDVLDFTVQAVLPDDLVPPVLDYLRAVRLGPGPGAAGPATAPGSGGPPLSGPLCVPHPVEVFQLRAGRP